MESSVADQEMVTPEEHWWRKLGSFEETIFGLRRAAAAKAGAYSAELTASLKRCPDTNPRV
jgi:hypothetical protein